MHKKQLIMLSLIAVLSISIISLYTTFAYDEEAAFLGNSVADYNLMYSIKDSSNREISLNAYEEKFVDIVLNNIYDSDLKYGMYYKLVNGNGNVLVNITDDSVDPLQGVIKSAETKTISLVIKNESDSKIDVVVGALVGFVQGNIEELQKEGEILIK